mgnify:FL=1
MGFKLRSTEGASPLKQGNYSLEQLERQQSEYGPADADGNRTRTYETKNTGTYRNRKQSASVAKDIYGRSMNDEDSRGYAGGNKGGILSSTKTIGGTSTRSTKFNESSNERSTEKEIRKALDKYGSAEVVDGVVQGRSTHQESKTINSRQYDALSGRITKGKARIKAKTTKKATIASKKAEKKKAQIAKVTAYRTARSAVKTANESKKAEKKKAQIAKVTAYRTARAAVKTANASKKAAALEAKNKN